MCHANGLGMAVQNLAIRETEQYLTVQILDFDHW